MNNCSKVHSLDVKMESRKTVYKLACAALVCVFTSACLSSSEAKVASVTFLLTVNDTWYPEEYNKTCLQTVKTPPLQPNTSWNESQSIDVGGCDYGPLTFQINEEFDNGKKESHAYIYLTFYSHVIEDASHPTCKILWDYKYREPTTYGAKESLLPGCMTGDSREGYHLTYYWFHILEWVLV